MSNENITSEAMSAMLSHMSVDDVASILVKATLGPDRALPVRAASSLLNLVSTCALLMIPTDRALVVNHMRDICDAIERDMCDKR